MKKIKVLVLEGGFNEEHEISLSTGEQVKKSLVNLDIEFESIIVNPRTFEEDIRKFSSDYICFNALHGTFGEDGQIQGILDKKSFKYTHSSSKASYEAFDKELTKKKISELSILTPDFLIIDNLEINEKKLTDFFLKFGAFIIKPVSSGSSFGVKIFNSIESVNLFFKNIKKNIGIYKDHQKILIEKFIDGRELTVSIIEKNKESIPVEVTEIIYKNDYFDYDSKYTPGISNHILPANISNHIYNLCKKNAKIIHDRINCRGVTRSDFIYSGNKLYFLEINTQPGLTPISLVPEQLKYQNISFDELILNLINCSL